VTANLLAGVSFGWWVPKHNAHHTNPNHQHLDPDVGSTALAFTADQASAKPGLLRLLARSQGWLLVPRLVVEAAQRHSASEGGTWAARSLPTTRAWRP
jgi:hypothetical protein